MWFKTQEVLLWVVGLSCGSLITDCVINLTDLLNCVSVIHVSITVDGDCTTTCLLYDYHFFCSFGFVPTWIRVKYE